MSKLGRLVVAVLLPAIAAAQSSAPRGHVHVTADSTTRSDPPETLPQSGGSLEPQLSLHAFADVRYSATDSTASHNGFALGQFDLFFRSQLSEDLSVLSETVITATPHNQFTTKLERLLLSFSPSDHLTVAVGRFHTGIGYYNAAYHHGTWFQTVVGRPLIFAFEGDLGIVPVHTLGITASGEIPSGALGLRYLMEIGSGRAGQASPAIAPQPQLSDNNDVSFNFGLVARPDTPDGLQLGLSVYQNRVTSDVASFIPMIETIGAGHLVYQNEDVELLVESVLLHHAPEGGGATANLWGHYAQISRALALLRPFVRYDYVSVPAADQLFGHLGRRSGPTFGIRYDFDPLAALKLQYSRLEAAGRRDVNRLDAQVAFTF